MPSIMPFRKKLRIPLSLVLICTLPACAHRLTNERLRVYAPNSGYRFKLHETGERNTNRLFVCLTFSGGGTRAAALSYGLLEKLAQTKIPSPADGKPVRLLDEVDLISAVSGGAFTAAYYRLFGDRIFKDFEEKFLNRDIQSELTWSILNPVNWFRLSSAWFDRIDLAAELYHKTIFEEKTFSDIEGQNPRPFVVINATNMAAGAQFSFTQDQFDLLGSNLDSYSVGNAVAASSAFPVALSPITLQNHPRATGYKLPDWVREGIASPLADLRQYYRAKSLAPYHLDKENHPYIHLIDGGVSDNLGLNVLLDEFRQGFIRELRHGSRPGENSATEGIDKLLVIVVNARTKLDQEIDKHSSAPGVFESAYIGASVSIDHHSLAMLELMHGSLKVTRKAQAAIDEVQKLLDAFSPSPTKLPSVQELQTYLVEINFDQIERRYDREKFLQMPTSLALERDQVSDLIRIAKELLEKNPEFQRFLYELPGGRRTRPDRAAKPNRSTRRRSQRRR